MKDYLREQFGDWYPILEPLLTSISFHKLGGVVAEQYTKNKGNIFPAYSDIFRAFKVTPFEKLKVVMLGQDPYHDEVNGKPRATGLAFANHSDTPKEKISPSLSAIFDEIEAEYEALIVDPDYSLQSWARQGVLLLNTALTVKRGQPGSHSRIWDPFTREVIKAIAANKEVVWLLLGRHAQNYIPLIEQYTQKYQVPGIASIAKAGHPSPLNTSGSFKNSGVFGYANELLSPAFMDESLKKHIHWSINYDYYYKKYDMRKYLKNESLSTKAT